MPQYNTRFNNRRVNINRGYDGPNANRFPGQLPEIDWFTIRQWRCNDQAPLIAQQSFILVYLLSYQVVALKSSINTILNVNEGLRKKVNHLSRTNGLQKRKINQLDLELAGWGTNIVDEWGLPLSAPAPQAANPEPEQASEQAPGPERAEEPAPNDQQRPKNRSINMPTDLANPDKYKLIVTEGSDGELYAHQSSLDESQTSPVPACRMKTSPKRKIIESSSSEDELID